MRRCFPESIFKWTLPVLALSMPVVAVCGEIGGLQRLSGEMEQLSTRILPKVVQITVQGLKVAGRGDEQPAGLLVDEHSRGSGFFVSADGYLLTNAHVVANGVRLTVLVKGQTSASREYPAQLIGIDSDNDLTFAPDPGSSF